MTAPDFLGQPENAPTHWQDRAACREIGAEAFFPPDAGKAVPDYAQARRVCRRCPVKAECLDFALRLDIREGLFGGLTPRQRAARKREAS